MNQERLPYLSRPLNFRLALGIPLAVMLLLLLLDPSTLDFALERWFYQPGQGFVGRHSYWLETVLHDRAKQGVILIWILALLGLLLSLLPTRLRPLRLNFIFLFLALSLSTSVVRPLKVLTGVQCPWSLTEFGGQQTFKPLLAKVQPGQSAGKCWPGGHASAGFSLLALYFALRDRYARAARIALWTAVGLGSLFSLGRMIQGAHFLSHNVWTLLIDWTICLLLYRLVLYRRPAPSLSVRPLTVEQSQ